MGFCGAGSLASPPFPLHDVFLGLRCALPEQCEVGEIASLTGERCSPGQANACLTKAPIEVSVLQTRVSAPRPAPAQTGKVAGRPEKAASSQDCLPHGRFAEMMPCAGRLPIGRRMPSGPTLSYTTFEGRYPGRYFTRSFLPGSLITSTSSLRNPSLGLAAG